MKENFIQKIVDIINIKIGIESKSGTNAYLGLTSKSETHYRDIIAHTLYQLYGKKYLIAREWKKCDLAILDKNTGLPIFLLELKVCYNVDLYKKSTINEYSKLIKYDLEKCNKFLCPESYAIMFIFKPLEEIPKELFPIVKYSKAINSGLKKMDHKTLNILGQDNLRKEFESIDFYHICKDESYNISCELDICVIKNLN